MIWTEEEEEELVEEIFWVVSWFDGWWLGAWEGDERDESVQGKAHQQRLFLFLLWLKVGALFTRVSPFSSSTSLT